MFADTFEIELGGAKVRGRRMTLKEIGANNADVLGGQFASVERCVEIIRSHVTLADGSAFDPLELSPRQMKTLIAELVLPEGGREISDFIGLLLGDAPRAATKD